MKFSLFKGVFCIHPRGNKRVKKTNNLDDFFRIKKFFTQKRNRRLELLMLSKLKERENFLALELILDADDIDLM